MYAACRCGSGWTWSRTRTLYSTSASPTSSTRVCQWWHRRSWTAVRCANTNWAKTRRPANCSTPRTFRGTASGSKGANRRNFSVVANYVILFLFHSLHLSVLGVAQWSARRFLTGEHSLIYAWSMVDMCPLPGFCVRYGSTNQTDSAFHPSGVGKWVIHAVTWITRVATVKRQTRASCGC